MFSLFFYGSSLFHCMCVCSVVSDSVTPWTVAHQAPLSTGFSRQEYWNGLLFPSPKKPAAAAAAAKSLQSCPTLCDPVDGSPPGSPVPEILQARTGVGCHFLLQCVKVKLLSRVRLLATPWTTAHQAPPSMGFSRQEYWSGLPLQEYLLSLTEKDLLQDTIY